MKHNNKKDYLGRTKSHRKAMLANMACSIIKHKRISTTTAKAKALRRFLEPLVTKSKKDSMHSRRTVFRYLNEKEAIKELYRNISPKIMDRPGGYLRIIKTNNRLGDNAQMSIIEFVDFNDVYSSGKGTVKRKSTRRSRSGGSKSSARLDKDIKTDNANKEVSVDSESNDSQQPKADKPDTDKPNIVNNDDKSKKSEQEDKK